MNIVIKSFTILILAILLVFSLSQILIGLDQDLKLNLNFVLVGLITIMATILLAGLSFLWVWWIASQGKFGN